MTSWNSSDYRIAPAQGKLGVMMPGLGAVATTFIAGVENIRRGRAVPIGSLSQMATIRLGQKEESRSPLLRDFVPLLALHELVFAAWAAIPDEALTAARKAGVLHESDIQSAGKLLADIKPLSAAFDKNYVRRINGA